MLDPPSAEETQVRTFLQWLGTCRRGEAYFCPPEALYEAYSDYCQTLDPPLYHPNREAVREPLSREDFTRALNAHGIPIKRHPQTGALVWVGIQPSTRR